MGVVVFALLIAAYFVIAQQAGIKRKSVAPSEASAKEINCDISVVNPRGIPLVKNGDLVIDSVNCQQQFVANCARFGVFSDKGTLRLEGEGGLGSATDISISEGQSKSYSLSWCGSRLASLFKIKLFNEDNENIHTKEVTLR